MGSMAEAASTSQKSPRGGKPTTAAEREERLRIVERCLAEGRTSTSEIAAELTRERGVRVPERTARGYVREVRNRRQAEDENIRAIRRSQLLHEAGKASRVILGLLISQKVKPRWADLIRLMEFRAEHGGVARAPESIPDVGHVEDKSDLEEMDESALDELLDEMLEKAAIEGDREQVSV